MTMTPKTMNCWRDGKWHADELANLAAKLERDAQNLPDILTLLTSIVMVANHQIPFYAYGENQAACEMATRLHKITAMVESVRDKITEQPSASATMPNA